MVREPCVAGQFYEGEKETLLKQIKDCFLSELGPGSLPENKEQGVVKGAIAPHAGYMFSGACAAFTYRRLAESQQPDTYVILGPNHTGFGRTSVLLEDFRTPLGIAEVDKEFGEALVKNVKIEDDPRVHSHEHSIEVQIPFLQFSVKKFKFVPVVVSSPHYINQLAEGIRRTSDELKRKICVIASSDFTHFGNNYGYMPFTDNVRENLEKLDKNAIGLIKKFDEEGFLKYIRETGATICGFLPIITSMKVIKQASVELLQYYTSADIMGDYSNSVSYASVIFT